MKNNKVIKALRWGVINIGLLLMFVYGQETGAEVAQNISIFLYWMLAILSFVILFGVDHIVEEQLKKEPGYTESVPKWFDNIFDTIVLLTLVAYGFFVLAGFYLFHIIVMEIVRQRFDEEKAKVKESS